MKPTGRLRLAGLALALLAAGLLIAPLLHCTLRAAGGHSHGTGEHSHQTTTALFASAVGDAAHAIADPGEHHGAPHDAHCVVTVALPVSAGGLVPLLSYLFMLVAAVIFAPVYRLGSGGVRGPPAAAVPIVSGRALLTRICIARR
ncbi:hypothetical protein ACQP2U_19685 [Nocardia sp. CA-084685]|uniref:hypothetical protein n=1 Tax=Nocardia sp. CA-084685 TaxID=3239970 RepID=UPI003D96D01C